MTLKERAELKPCPFCGCNRIEFIADATQGTKWGFARCTECGVAGPEVRTQYDLTESAKWHKYALESWNTRTVLAGATDKEALREVVEFTVQYFYGNRPEKVDKVFVAYLAKKGEG